MITILSPAKKMNDQVPYGNDHYTLPQLIEDSKILVEELQKHSPEELSQLMQISHDIATMNYERYIRWDTPFTPQNASQALFAFKGQAYQGLKAHDFSQEDITFAQDHLRILSGLYGILRPRDLIMPYRLEMGTKLINPHGKDLYEFWNNKITKALNKALSSHDQKVVVNLASNEYFKSIKPGQLKADIVTPVFREEKGNQYKTIAVYAKIARGMMTQYIIQNRIDDPRDIKGFDWQGYAFTPSMSTESKWIFVR